MVRKETRRNTADRFRINLQAALEFHGENAVSIAKPSGVSQSMIYAVLRGEARPTVDMADALARALGYNGWELLLPSFQPSHRIRDLFDAYTSASDEGRKMIDAIAARESTRTKAK